MEQFKKQFPDVTINVVSNKSVEGNVWGWREESYSMVFEDTYMEWREDTYYCLGKINFTNGQAAQDYLLGDTDDSQLTERERLLSVLPLIKWMIERDILTKECKTELRIYYREYNEGKFDGLLGDDEADEIRKDLFDCYHKVFGE